MPISTIPSTAASAPLAAFCFCVSVALARRRAAASKRPAERHRRVESERVAGAFVVSPRREAAFVTKR
jgi:hypothetical protein